MKTVEFQFEPLQLVRVHAYGLNYDARVVKCIYTGGPMHVYDCDYAADGKIEVKQFYEDELVAL